MEMLPGIIISGGTT